MKNAFDPHEQAKSVDAKIIAGIERLSTVFRAAIQQEAKVNKITPLQAQLLLFIAGHDRKLCTVTKMAEEFVVTKPTISDSLRVLLEKAYLNKITSVNDMRGYSVTLTPAGEKLVTSLHELTNVFSPMVEHLTDEDKQLTMQSILQLIRVFQWQNIIPSRMCQTCRHFQNEGGSYFCRLMQVELYPHDLRLDCPEHEAIK